MVKEYSITIKYNKWYVEKKMKKKLRSKNTLVAKVCASTLTCTLNMCRNVVFTSRFIRKNGPLWIVWLLCEVKSKGKSIMGPRSKCTEIQRKCFIPASLDFFPVENSYLILFCVVQVQVHKCYWLCLPLIIASLSFCLKKVFFSFKLYRCNWKHAQSMASYED